MKKTITQLLLIFSFTNYSFAQNQLQSITNLARQTTTTNLINQDSLFYFYKPGNATSATQINKIWARSELLQQPNFDFKPILRTFADSSVEMGNGYSFTSPLQIKWANTYTYNVTYTQLLKNSTFIYWNGNFSSQQTSDYYYSPLIDSVYFYQGPVLTTSTTIALKRYYFKSTTGLTDSITDKYPSNGQLIRWKFSYNSFGNLIEWKYSNPQFSSSNKLYKLFYTGNSNLVDSLKSYSNGLSYLFTYIYTYNISGEWSTISYKDINSSAYPNGIKWYRNATWGNQLFCNSFNDNYYFPLYQLQSNKNINDFNATSYLLNEKSAETQPNSNIFMSSTKYNYNTTATSIKSTTINNLNFTIFPNPANGIINIELLVNNLEASTTIFITNILGEEVLKTTATSNNFSLKTNGLTSGVYFLTVSAQNKLFTKKIIIN